MVGKVLGVVYKEIRGLHEAAYILAVFTFGSQILALIRDRLLAHQFGAGIELDLYYTAFRIPDLLFVVFASVLSVYVLIPFVAKEQERGGDEAVRGLLSQVFSVFLVGYGIMALIAAIFSEELVHLFFPGYGNAEYEMLSVLLSILLLQPLLLSISNLFGVVTQVQNRFVLYALSPLLYNIGIIIGIVLLYPVYGLPGLACGVVVGALLHLGVQVPLIMGSTGLPRVTFTWDTTLLMSILRTSVPRALTLSLHQIVLLALVGIASAMPHGSVSVFQFAFNLQSVPLAIIGVSYSVAAFPALSKMFTNGDRTLFISHVATALRHIFFWSVPAIALIVVIRAQIVRVILGSGAFNWDDTRLTAAALALFMLSLAAQAVNLLVVRAFYAGGDTRTPLYVTVGSSFLALTLSLVLYALFITGDEFRELFERIFRVSGVGGTEVLMLPLGYSAAILIHTSVLLGLFMRRFSLPFGEFGGVLSRGLIAAVMGGVMAYAVLNTVVFGVQTDTVIGIMLQGAVSGIAGMATVILALYFLGSPELREAGKALHRRMLVRTTVIPPQQSDDVAA